MKQTVEFKRLGNDLFADFQCQCPSPNFIGTDIEHLMKRKITLSGYADAYFFKVVNAEPNIFKCDCGRVYKYQWFPHGVEIEEVKEDHHEPQRAY
ncbi:hypothetical protein CathTA2_2432 [Caldalkalibacillus thermarum TA2.A1]|uniref:Uncharacterized protein n=1 Tax=Caldalkalibacillus thermarum (strain TA2.A1) TaxID=986075 RepID=F5L9C7_CALTT|nr:hypothetical protein [Caldalkalibacillus thermarum]EGL82069.1 hypothetical protein CathTA2_2432 [Caldalkalibacillus thermarum TA2.A1]QZT34014.1 hypothetical protein HUR95_00815 [Caldalkalibacillus thermarum TA2.A1]